MNIETFDLRIALYALIAAGAIHYLLLRRTIRGFFDPAAYVALSTTFACALTYSINGASPVTWRMVSNVLFFWLGWIVLTRRTRKSTAITQGWGDVNDWSLLKVGLVTLLLVFLCSNAYLWGTAGIPGLAEDVALMKTEGFSAGLGFVRRVNWGAGLFLVMGLTLWVLRSRSFAVLVLYLAVLGVLGLSGSKAGLLPALFAISLVMRHPNAPLAPASRSFARCLLVIVLVAGAVALLALIVTGGEADLRLRLAAIVVRLFYFGDVMLYWSDPAIRLYFGDIGPLDYPAHLLNPLFGMFRLAEYQVPLGNLMVQQSLGASENLSEALGPNTPFYVKGELFLGPAFALLYSLAIGATAGALRRAFDESHWSSPVSFCLRGTLFLMIPALAMEDSLFVSMVLDMLLVVIPVLFFAAGSVLAVSAITRDVSTRASPGS